MVVLFLDTTHEECRGVQSLPAMLSLSSKLLKINLNRDVQQETFKDKTFLATSKGNNELIHDFVLMTSETAIYSNCRNAHH